MALSKKHFERIAYIIRIAGETAAREESAVTHAAILRNNRDIANTYANDFAQENPRFDRGRFMAACGF